MSRHVYFIRHGETEWTLTGRHTGRTEVPLTTQGEADARRLGTRLPKETFSRVFSSPRERARRTCDLTGLAAAVDIDPDLAEWDYGEYEGLRSAEIRMTRPDWNIFRDGCPHGESSAALATRADRVIARLRQAPGDVALFSHGHFGRVFAARWIRQPVTLAEHLRLSTASLSIFEWDPAGGSAPAIALWNAEARHLCDAPEPLGDARSLRQRALARWDGEGGEIPASPPRSFP